MIHPHVSLSLIAAFVLINSSACSRFIDVSVEESSFKPGVSADQRSFNPGGSMEHRSLKPGVSVEDRSSTWTGESAGTSGPLPPLNGETRIFPSEAGEVRIQDDLYAAPGGRRRPNQLNERPSGQANAEMSGAPYIDALAERNTGRSRVEMGHGRGRHGTDDVDGSDTPLRDVFFDFDSWKLSEEGAQALLSDAEWLRQHPNQVLTIEGHCDERGTLAYNLVLGEKRARAVRNFIVNLDIAAERLSTVSYGKERPFCDTADESCYQRNRRGHLVADTLLSLSR